MIPRFLVPKDARPPAAEGAAPRRLNSELDARTLVPSDLPHIELDPRTSIPAHMPIDVLAQRIVVPRDMPSKPLDAIRHIPDYVQLTILDSRVAVPKDARPADLESKPLVAIQDLPDVLEPDVITTGEVILLNKPVQDRVSGKDSVSRIVSIAFHFVVVLFLLFEPSLFPAHTPTQAEVDLARQQLSFIYMPPDVRGTPREAPPPEASSPHIRIDPRILRQLAPNMPEISPSTGPKEPERVVREAPPAQPPAPVLPSAPTPQPAPTRTQAQAAPENAFPIETPKPTAAQPNGLILPKLSSSPGKTIQDSMNDATRSGGNTGVQFGGPGPAAPRADGMPGGGGGQGYYGGNLQILTPTEGVDFTNYLARVLASVRNSWYAVIPESARLGEKGRVVLRFKIMRDGSVPSVEPVLEGSSGRQPLDNAALSSIRASNPFEPLPTAFRGPYIELRFIFLYNLPINYQ